MDHKVQLPGREEMSLSLECDPQGVVKEAKLTGVGGPDFLELMQQWRPLLQGPVQAIPLPEGVDVASILLRELLKRARGEWKYPYSEQELCHCRAVPTQVVDTAVITGAHTPEEVSEKTSASTACGTCRGDVQAIIACRLENRC